MLRFLAAHDSGRILNPLTFRNQVFGGITMGIGFGMTEERVMDRGQRGKVLTAGLHDYKLPTALDVPADKTLVIVDPHDTECNSTGAKGVGEPATIPTAAAIANAVFNATGVRLVGRADEPDARARRARRAARPRRARRGGRDAARIHLRPGALGERGAPRC